MSVAAAAEKLHLDPKVIEALEADRFAELGASVYVRGHLRRYADFVGEPGTELVNMLHAREARAAAPDLTQVPHAESRADPRRLATPLVGLAARRCCWPPSGGCSPARNPMAMRVARRAGHAGGPAVRCPCRCRARCPCTPATALPRLAVVMPAPPSRHAPPRAGAGPSAPARKAAAPVRETRLRLELTNDSWVEVYDSRGERLFYDVASAGSVQSVSGRGPLRVVLGNAAGVTVEVDGQAREIPANAVDGEGARFVVNRSGSLVAGPIIQKIRK